MCAASPNPIRFTFPRRMRLSGKAAYTKVYDEKARASAGPLLVYGAPNAMGAVRLGLAVPRRVGTAVKRNAIKRRLREAFRLIQHQLPKLNDSAGYDLVINVRGHELLSPVQYQTLLMEAAEALHKTWRKRRDRKPSR
jgi:ribonuclease P protein component